MVNYNPFSLSGKIILVTGASSGIGRSCAIECSKMGADVILTGRNKDRLQETLEIIKENETETKSFCIVADLNNDDDLGKLVEECPSLNGIVHCAGIDKPLMFKFAGKDYMDSIMKTNFSSPALLTQLLLKAKKLEKESSIVFLSSINGIKISSPASAGYAASKAAILGLVKPLAIELAPRKIRVNALCPGMVNTPILSESAISEEQLELDRKKYPLGRYGEPDEIAKACVYFLSDASKWVTGTELVIDGGFTLL